MQRNEVLRDGNMCNTIKIKQLVRVTIKEVVETIWEEYEYEWVATVVWYSMKIKKLVM